MIFKKAKGCSNIYYYALYSSNKDESVQFNITYLFYQFCVDLVSLVAFWTLY